MKLRPLLLSMMVALMCFVAGCGTSQEESQSLLSIPEDESWVELELPTPSVRPETETVLPELDKEDKLEQDGKDVTDDYKNTFLGVWDNESKTKTYEFKSNENLIVGTVATGEVYTYTYWFVEVSGQPRLCIYANGQEEALSYSFTLSGSNMTLYDLTTGNAVEFLTRQPVVQSTPTPTPKPTTKVTAAPTAAPTATPAPSQTAAPSPSPTVVPSPSPTAEPSPSPTVEPSASPSPAPSPSPSVVPSPSPSPAVTLPDFAANALPGVECVLDVVSAGKSFDAANPDAFWSILARYMSLKKPSDDEGYITVSPEDVVGYAKKIFPEFTDESQIPACPEGSKLVEQVTEDEEVSYRVLWGATSGHEVEVVGYENQMLTILLDGTDKYNVLLNEDGTISQVEKVL